MNGDPGHGRLAFQAMPFIKYYTPRFCAHVGISKADEPTYEI